LTIERSVFAGMQTRRETLPDASRFRERAPLSPADHDAADVGRYGSRAD
jgi:hypothetical protein